MLNKVRGKVMSFLLIYIGLIALYHSHFTNFLYQDDFFNITLTRHQSLVDAFNIFKKPLTEFVFYRPFSTQLFWHVGWNLFGLSPTGYHIINFAFFLASIYLVFKLTYLLLKNTRTSLLACFFYAFSASHFYRLYFLSQFQEVSLAFFTLLTLVLFIKKSKWTPLAFLLSLTTKETAVMTPIGMTMLTLFLPKPRKNYFKLLVACYAILFTYLFARFFYFGFAGGDSYEFDLSIRKTLNNFLWYSLWSLGLPEAFVNVTLFRFPTIFNPLLFTEFGRLGNVVLGIFALLGILIITPLVRFVKTFNTKLILYFFLYVVYLLPILFFPFHKFPYGLAVPLIGVSLILAHSLAMMGPRYVYVVCALYIALAVATNQFNSNAHWSNKRALMTEAVFTHLSQYLPAIPQGKNIYFRNTEKPMCLYIRPNEPYYSREIYFAVNGPIGIRLLYDNSTLPVYFEDVDNLKHYSSSSIVLEAPQFFR